MSSAFSSIKQGLEEAVAFSRGNERKAVTHEFTAVDLKDLLARESISLEIKGIEANEKRI